MIDNKYVEMAVSNKWVMMAAHAFAAVVIVPWLISMIGIVLVVLSWIGGAGLMYVFLHLAWETATGKINWAERSEK